MGTYSTTLLTGITLSSESQNPVTITSTAYIGDSTAENLGSVFASSRTQSFNVYNFGRVATTDAYPNHQLVNFKNGILLNGGGYIYNGTTGLVTATGAALQVSNAGGTIVNLGTAVAANPLGEHYSVQAPFGVGASVDGLLVNGALGTTSSLIEGSDNGVDVPGNGQAGTVKNFAVIEAENNSVRPGYYGGTADGCGVDANGGSLIVNYQGANIQGHAFGVVSANGGTVINSGLIAAALTGTVAGGTGIAFFNGGYASNSSTGVISGVNFGIGSYNGTYGGTAGSIVNAGLIEASSTLGGIGISLQVGGSTVTNAGTISGSGNAIRFSGNANRLIVDPGASFFGTVYTPGTSGTSTLELAVGNHSTGTLAGLGSEYYGFSKLQFDSGAHWEVAAPVSGFPGTITGFTVGDTIDVTGFVAVGKTFANDSLILTDSVSNHATLGIQGSFSTANFSISGDGNTGTLVVEVPTTVSDDFNGDGMSDLLLQYEDTGNASDPGNGDAAIWLMNGTSITSNQIVAEPGANWDIVGTGDFNGDGKADLVWQYEDTANSADPANGATSIWLMDGTAPTTIQTIAEPGSSWHVVGTGDFTGNGDADLVWQYEDASSTSDPLNGETSVWLMNGTTPTSIQAIAQPGGSWHVVATGDFNGDGKSDLVWQYEDASNSSDPLNGETSIWLMNGAMTIAEAAIAQPGANWHVVATGDFTGNGMSDLLWQYEDTANPADPGNGETSVWLMNGTSVTSVQAIAAPGANWHVIGTGDYNGDGKADILWQYENTANPSDAGNGAISIWLMNGTMTIAQAAIAQPGASWHVT